MPVRDVSSGVVLTGMSWGGPAHLRCNSFTPLPQHLKRYGIIYTGGDLRKGFMPTSRIRCIGRRGFRPRSARPRRVAGGDAYECLGKDHTEIILSVPDSGPLQRANTTKRATHAD